MPLTTKQIDKVNNLLKLPIVLIKWRDAASKGGWKSVEDYRKDGQTLECISTGFLISNSKHTVQLVQSIAENSTVADSIAIPKSEIKSMRVIRKGAK